MKKPEVHAVMLQWCMLHRGHTSAIHVMSVILSKSVPFSKLFHLGQFMHSHLVNTSMKRVQCEET